MSLDPTQIGELQNLAGKGPPRKATQWIVAFAVLVCVSGGLFIIPLHTTLRVFVVAVSVIGLLIVMLNPMSASGRAFTWICLAFFATCLAAVAIQLFAAIGTGTVSVPPIDMDSPPHYSEGFFRSANAKVGMFAEIRDKHNLLKADGVQCKRDLWIHFIEPKFQLGIHAFCDLSPTSPGVDGHIPLRLVPASGQVDPIFSVLAWNPGDEPIKAFPLQRAPQDKSASLVIPAHESQRFRAVFRYYPDPEKKADFFILTAAEFHDPASNPQPTVVEHIVVMRRSDVSRWHPNQFSYYVDPSAKQPRPFWHSGIVYALMEAKAFATSPETADAREVLRAVSVTNMTNIKADWIGNFNKEFPALFPRGLPGDDLVLYRATFLAPSQDIVMIYRFANGTGQ